MDYFRAFRLVLTSFAILVACLAAGAGAKAAAQQQLVESVDIQGNRRLRDDDLIYYINTRPGDVFDPAKLEIDLRTLLSLNWFDKSATKVIVTDGLRGGVNVIFEVKEWPIIRDLQFKGLKGITESDVLKAFRESRVGISKEAIFDPVKARAGSRVLREMLASKGFPNAKITIKEEEVSATSIAVTFEAEAGLKSRIIKIEFEGNKAFKDGELRGAMELVRKSGFISRFKGQDILDLRKLEHDLRSNVRAYMFSKGYFQARIGDPVVEGLGVKRTDILPIITLPLPLLSSKDDALKIIVPITEGRIFRIGEVKVEGNSIFSEAQIVAFLGLKNGDIADGKRLQDVVFDLLKTEYGTRGFINYEAEFVPDFKDNPSNPEEGIVDITINIDEGKQFELHRLEFSGNTFTRDRVMRREFLLNEGDIYNQRSLDISVVRLNQLGLFDPIDKDQDVDKRTDEDLGEVDLNVKVKERGRQQISFNGGASGLGGNFFGLEYSTNNLGGRGQTLSFAVSLGNRTQSFQFTFQEPFFRNRPISVGFSFFGSKAKFFGEGTVLTQNQNILDDLFNPLGQILTDERNLFTQKTFGGSVFVTAPLSEFYFKKRRFTQFTRIGLTYLYSATTITDPEINQSEDPTLRIPIIFDQPNITTSKITGSFVYDTRQPAPNGLDSVRGTQLAVSVALAGLGGDVRTYQPNVSYTSFIPIRRKRSKNPDVLAFRLTGGTIGSFASTSTVKNANSFAFVGGVPIFDRYFLGSENDIRGYTSRAIGPIATLDTFVTTRNVVAATNSFGEAVPIPGFPEGSPIPGEIASLGLLTGDSGASPALFSRNFQFIGGDTQLLGNLEYRIPIFGPATLALFADGGSVFNLRNTGDQRANSEFLQDDVFLGAGSVTALSLRNNPSLESSFGSILFFRNRILTKSDFLNEFCGGNRFGCPTSLSPEVQQIFLRGEAQQNRVLRVDNAAFDSINDFKASVGVEFRIQVPVVNVPFRLIYFVNPNGKFGFTDSAPGLFLPGKRKGFRFTVGRTF